MVKSISNSISRSYLFTAMI